MTQSWVGPRIKATGTSGLPQHLFWQKKRKKWNIQNRAKTVPGCCPFNWNLQRLRYLHQLHYGLWWACCVCQDRNISFLTNLILLTATGTVSRVQTIISAIKFQLAMKPWNGGSLWVHRASNHCRPGVTWPFDHLKCRGRGSSLSLSWIITIISIMDNQYPYHHHHWS